MAITDCVGSNLTIAQMTVCYTRNTEIWKCQKHGNFRMLRLCMSVCRQTTMNVCLTVSGMQESEYRCMYIARYACVFVCIYACIYIDSHT